MENVVEFQENGKNYDSKIARNNNLKVTIILIQLINISITIIIIIYKMMMMMIWKQRNK